MVQTAVVVALILVDAVLIQLNLGVLQAPVSLSVPGTDGFVATPMLLLVVVGVTLVLGWLAGQVDRAILERQVRHRDATLRVMSEELLRLKVATFEQQPSLADLRTRLDVLDREVHVLHERVHQRASEAFMREATEGGDRPPQQRVTVTS